MTRSVLVTGANGLLGSHVVSELLGSGYRVIGVDRSDGQARENFTSHTIDLEAPGSALGPLLRHVEGVFHLAAALTGGDQDTPERTYRRNTLINANVLFGASEAGIGWVIYASSQSVLGHAWAREVKRPAYLPVDERHPTTNEEAYGLSKLAGEELLAMLARFGTLSSAALRFPVIWHPDRHAENTSSRIGNPVQAAKSMWAYIDARDAARACRLAFETSHDGFAVTNIASPVAFCDRDIRQLVNEWYGAGLGEQLSGPSSAVYDWRLAQAKWGFVARYIWTSDGIEDRGDNWIPAP